MLSPETSTPSAETQQSENRTSAVETECGGNGTKACQEAEHAPGAATAAKTAPTSWFSRLTGWGSKAAPTDGTPAVHTMIPQRGPLKPSIQPEATVTVLPSTRIAASNTHCTSFQVASHASDARIPPPPETMRVSGYFSDYHYKHLHILWLKSLTPTFTRPGSVRPTLEKHIGKKIYTGDGEFAWEVTRRDAEVIERWFRSFEGREAREIVGDWRDAEGRYRKIGWDEWHLCMSLFGIIVGQELRREERERKGTEAGK